MFNDKVVQVLSQVQGITDSLVIRYPTTVAINETRDIMVSFDISKLDSDEFEDICLYKNLGSFLGLLKLFGDDRQVSISDNLINICNSDGSKTSNIVMQNIEIMDFFNVDNSQIERTLSCPSVAEFDINVSDFKNLKSAMGVLKNLDEIAISSSDGGVKFTLKNSNKYQKISDAFSLFKEGTVSKDFEVFIDCSKFLTLPVSAYTFMVKYNEPKDAYRLIVRNKTLDNFIIMIALKAN